MWPSNYSKISTPGCFLASCWRRCPTPTPVLCASALSLPLDPIIPGDKIISFRKIGSGNSRTNKTNKAAGRIALSHVPVQQRLAPVSHSKGMARRKGPRSQAAADAALAPACRPARPRGSAACPCPGPLPGSQWRSQLRKGPRAELYDKILANNYIMQVLSKTCKPTKMQDITF